MPRHSRATTSIVIVDPLQSVQEPVALARSSVLDLVHQDADEVAFVAPAGQMCVGRLPFTAIFGLLALLTTVQAVFVVRFLLRRRNQSKI